MFDWNKLPRYHGLSLKGTLTQGPYSVVHYKGSWLYVYAAKVNTHCKIYVIYM